MNLQILKLLEKDARFTIEDLATVTGLTNAEVEREIAEMTGISRQGVWDIIKRAEETLRKTEGKTGLMRRFRENQAAVAEM